MLPHSTMSREKPVERINIPEVGFCAQKKRLDDEFLQAIHELNVLLSQQTRAVIDGDPDFSRFDVLLHLAEEKKNQAKYAWIAHVESHHC
jgi:hypothetical protein